MNNTVVAVMSADALGHCMPMRYPLNLKRLRIARGMSQDQLAELMGVEQPTIQRWESGSREPKVSQISELAEVLGVDPGELFSADGPISAAPRLFVKGSVAAGIWQEAYEWHEEDWQPFTGRMDVHAPALMRFGLRVDGDSMNEVYPPNTIVECVSLMAGAEIQSGKRVIVTRRRRDMEIEATVKEFVIDAHGKRWLVPRSSNPAFQNPIPLDNGDDPDIIETCIIAVVVASIRPE